MAPPAVCVAMLGAHSLPTVTLGFTSYSNDTTGRQSASVPQLAVVQRQAILEGAALTTAITEQEIT